VLARRRCRRHHSVDRSLFPFSSLVHHPTTTMHTPPATRWVTNPAGVLHTGCPGTPFYRDLFGRWVTFISARLHQLALSRVLACLYPKLFANYYLSSCLMIHLSLARSRKQHRARLSRLPGAKAASALVALGGFSGKGRSVIFETPRV